MRNEGTMRKRAAMIPGITPAAKSAGTDVALMTP